MSYATIFIPGSGILESYKDPVELSSAIGIYLITWMFVTFFFLCVFLIVSVRCKCSYFQTASILSAPTSPLLSCSVSWQQPLVVWLVVNGPAQLGKYFNFQQMRKKFNTLFAARRRLVVSLVSLLPWQRTISVLPTSSLLRLTHSLLFLLAPGSAVATRRGIKWWRSTCAWTLLSPEDFSGYISFILAT